MAADVDRTPLTACGGNAKNPEQSSTRGRCSKKIVRVLFTFVILIGIRTYSYKWGNNVRTTMAKDVRDERQDGMGGRAGGTGMPTSSPAGKAGSGAGDARPGGNGLAGAASCPSCDGSQPGALVLEKRPDRIAIICDGVTDIAAALFGVCGRELRSPGRSPLAVSRVRQIAMYVTHVTLRLSMADVGQGFGRDRTTVLYACHQIEDLREDAEFDDIVARVEQVVMVAFGLRAGQE